MEITQAMICSILILARKNKKLTLMGDASRVASPVNVLFLHRINKKILKS